MQELLVEEVTEFLGRAKHQRHGVDMQGYRNGYGKPRRLTMRTGTVTVRRPRVRDPLLALARLAAECNTTVELK